MPHHVSEKHPPMSMHDRAAQFGSFSPLTGLSDELEAARSEKNSLKELSEDMAERLDRKINILERNADKKPFITVEYFSPEKGIYVTEEGNYKRTDPAYGILYFTDGRKLPARLIYSIEGEIFAAGGEEETHEY